MNNYKDSKKGIISSIKNLLFWSGILLCTMSFFVYTGFYETPPNIFLGNIIILIGITFLFVASPHYSLIVGLKTEIGLISVLILIILFLPYPYNIGPLFLTVFFLGSKTKIQLFGKFYLPSTALTIQTITFWVVYSIFPNLHQIKGLNIIYVGVLKLLGAKVNLFHNNLVLRSGDSTIAFFPSFEQLGIPIFIVFFIPPLIMMLSGLFSKNNKTLGRFVLLNLIYLFLRYMFLILLVPFYQIDFPPMQIFWGTIPTIISFIPLIVLLTFSMSLKHNENEIIIKTNILKWSTILGIVVFFCILSFSIIDPGKQNKKGRILFDEYHGEGWETITEPLDTKNFGGQRSVYTYYSWVEWMKNFYSVDIALDPEKYEELNIENYDILVLKTPTRPFSKNNIEKITTFVENGGGLLLLGDHTNLLNMNEHLNDITKKWGLEFVSDATFDLNTTSMTIYTPQRLFPHPIVQNIEKYKFATSCSLKTNFFFRNIMIGHGLGAEWSDLSHPNFFGDLKLTPEDRWGLFTQCAARKVEKGRIVAFSDSTTFSSYSLFMHDNPYFILSIFEYLNRTSSDLWKFFQIITISVFIVFLIFIVKYKKEIFISHNLTIFLIILSLVITITNVTSQYVNKINYVEPVNISLKNDPAVYFYLGHSPEITIPHFIGYTGMFSPAEKEFSSFFIAFQRAGFALRETTNLQECLEGNLQAIVIIEPTYNFKKSELNGLSNYVFEGGTLILCDSIFNNNSTLRNILSSFELDLNKRKIILPIKTSEYMKESTNDLKNESDIDETFVILPFINYFPTTIQGSSEWEYFKSKKYENLFLFKKSFGSGQIAILSDSYLVSNAVLGDPGSPPTQTQYELYQEIFDFLDILREKR